MSDPSSKKVVKQALLGLVAILALSVVAGCAVAAATQSPVSSTPTTTTPEEYLPPGETADTMAVWGMTFILAPNDVSAVSQDQAVAALHELASLASVTAVRKVRYSNDSEEDKPGHLRYVDRLVWIVTLEGLDMPSYGRSGHINHILHVVVDAQSGEVLSGFTDK